MVCVCVRTRVKNSDCMLLSLFDFLCWTSSSRLLFSATELAVLERPRVKRTTTCAVWVWRTTRTSLVSRCLGDEKIGEWIAVCSHSTARWTNYHLARSASLDLVCCQYLDQECFVGVSRRRECLTGSRSMDWCRPTDDGTKMEAPGPLVNAAIDYAIKHVRVLLHRPLWFSSFY